MPPRRGSEIRWAWGLQTCRSYGAFPRPFLDVKEQAAAQERGPTAWTLRPSSEDFNGRKEKSLVRHYPHF